MFVTLSYRRGQSVLEHNYIPTARHFACGGVPNALRPQLWRMIFGLPPFKSPSESSRNSNKNNNNSNSNERVSRQGEGQGVIDELDNNNGGINVNTNNSSSSNNNNNSNSNSNSGIGSMSSGMKRPRTAGGGRRNGSNNSLFGGGGFGEDFDQYGNMPSMDSSESIELVELNEKLEYESLLARVESLELITDKLVELDIESVADE
jgi:hypothetical protein